MSSRLRTRLRAGTGLSTPSLNLEFQTAAGTLDPRITFSRTSQATLVDATGKLTYAPNNLLTNSQDFESANWSKSALGLGVAPVVTANAAVAPDGTTTADRVQFSVPGNTTNPSDFSQLVQIPAGSGTAVVGSVWMRSNTGTNQTVMLRAGDTFTSFTVTPTWQRFTASQTTAASSNYFNIGIRGSVTPNVVSADVLIWGAQLEQVTYQTTPGTYNSTSPKNLLGYTQEFDNAAWTKSNAFVQTNLLTYSEAFDNAAWTKFRTNVTADAGASPSGVTSADRLIPTAVSGSHGVVELQSLTSGSVYTFSFYAKASGYNNISVSSYSGTAVPASTQTWYVDLSTGAIVGTPANWTFSVVSAGGGWYRIRGTFTATGTSASDGPAIYVFDASGNPVFTGDGASGVLLWGAQLVQGSTAGDYQRTDAAAAAVQYVAPDGSRTADKAVVTATTSFAGVSQFATITVGTTFTFSAYAKMAEWRYVALSPNGSADYAVFDLQNGSIAVKATSTIASIQSVGNGWYRCTLSYAEPSAASRSFAIFPNNTGAFTSQTGDGTSGIYIWGAQLSNSASLDPYVYNPVAAPTSAAYYGPRFDYDPVTLANKGLLIEEQRTNLLTYSQEFDNNTVWGKAGSTITVNAIAAPDGTLTGDKLVETATTAEHLVIYAGVGTGQRTASVYFKAAERTRAYIYFYNATDGVSITFFDLSNGTVTSGAGTITAVGNGWYRCSLTRTATASDGVYFGATTTSGTTTYAGTAGSGIYLYGAQLEAGAFATSYIPTVASQVTRTADVALMQGANFSNWYNASEGTFAVRGSTLTTINPAVPAFLAVSDGTNLNYAAIFADNSLGRPQFAVFANGNAQCDLFNFEFSNTANTPFGAAAAYKLNDFAMSTNGLSVNLDSLGSMPTVDRMGIGCRHGNSRFLNGHIQRIGYYPTRLANAQLQSLTAQSTIPSLSLDFTTQVFNVG